MTRSNINLWFFVVIIILISGCRTRKEITEVPALPMLTGKQIVRNVEAHDFDFERIFFKRAMINFRDGSQNLSFKANVYLKRDSFIVLSITPVMGIELYRILLNPQGVKVLDRMNRELIVSDYDGFYKQFLIQPRFSFIQDILSNRMVSWPPANPLSSYKLVDHKRSQSYSLVSKVSRPYPLPYHRGQDYETVIHEINVEPNLFRVENNLILHPGLGIKFAVIYSGFQSLDASGNSFPHNMVINGSRLGKNFEGSLKFSEVEFDGANELSFKVPGKYETVYR